MARYLGIGKETTYGTAVVADRYLDIIKETLKASQEPLYPETVRARNVSDAIPGPFKVAGSFDLYPEMQTIGAILEALLGTVTTTGGGPDYQHDFTIADVLPSLTGYIGVDDKVRKIPGMVVKSLAFEAPAKELLSLSVDVFGQKEEIDTIGTPTFGTDPFPVFHQGTVNIAGSPVANIEAIRCSIENNVDEDAFVIGSRFIQRAEVQGIQITGSLDLQFTSWDEYQRFLSGTTSGTTPGSTLGEVSIDCLFELATNKSIKLDLSNCVYETSNANIDRRERIVQNVEFRATGVNPLTLTLKNQQATP